MLMASMLLMSMSAYPATELWSSLGEARSALGLPLFSYTTPGLTAGDTPRAVHFQELRSAIK